MAALAGSSRGLPGNGRFNSAGSAPSRPQKGVPDDGVNEAAQADAPGAGEGIV
jgi:hypothetical protein